MPTKKKRTMAELREEIAILTHQISILHESLARRVQENQDLTRRNESLLNTCENINDGYKSLKEEYEQNRSLCERTLNENAVLVRKVANLNIINGNLKTTLQETALDGIKIAYRLKGAMDGLVVALRVLAGKKNEEDDGGDSEVELNHFTAGLDQIIADLEGSDPID